MGEGDWKSSVQSRFVKINDVIIIIIKDVTQGLGVRRRKVGVLFDGRVKSDENREEELSTSIFVTEKMLFYSHISSHFSKHIEDGDANPGAAGGVRISI